MRYTHSLSCSEKGADRGTLGRFEIGGALRPAASPSGIFSRVGHRSRGAFTLIELLVVVSIIALLIAILLPSLQYGRATAVSAQCKSNLRGIGIDTNMFADGNKGSWIRFSDGVALRWTYYIDSFMQLSTTSKNQNHFLCPADQSPVTVVGVSKWEYGGGFIINNDLSANGTGSQVPAKCLGKPMAQVNRPSNYATFWDTNTPLTDSSKPYVIDRSNWSARLPEGRHITTGNVLFMDSHVQAVVPAAIPLSWVTFN